MPVMMSIALLSKQIILWELMNKYEICIEGKNFLIERDGKVKKQGFYAARFIEAPDMSAATKMAMDSFREELKGRVLNEESDPPRMKVLDVRDVYFFEKTMVFGDTELKPEGFLWLD